MRSESPHELTRGTLENLELLPGAGLIAGKRLTVSSSGQTFNVTNPSSGDVIVTLPDMGIVEILSAIDAAFIAQKS